MEDIEDKERGAQLVRLAQLRARWGGMPSSTFYHRLHRGLIPPPVYPFGPHTPYWPLESIVEFERRAVPLAGAGDADAK
jgi:hypothetical protein